MATMNVSLTPELEKFVEDKVKSGRYASNSEVVRDALRLLETHENVIADQIADLKLELAKAEEAIREGRVSSGEEVFARLRQRRNQRSK